MPIAEIIAIGTELLLGETQDTNTSYLARKLRDNGIDMFRATIIGDNAQRIANLIKEARERSQIIITTGGLGPTVDDPTRQAVAMSLGVDIEFRPELWDQILRKYKSYNRIPTENNRRQAFIPCGAVGIGNPVGTAPGFYHESDDKIIISLPGVPREMEYLFIESVMPYLKKKYDLISIIKVKIIHTAGMGESQIDQIISDLENYENPTVGLSAHPGQCDIRITAKADSEKEADRLINEIQQEVDSRLGNSIFGYDGDTLEGKVLEKLQSKNSSIGLVDCDIGALILTRLNQKTEKTKQNVFRIPVNKGLSSEYLIEKDKIDFILRAELFDKPDRKELTISLLEYGNNIERTIFSYGGPSAMGEKWAINTTLNFIRRKL